MLLREVRSLWPELPFHCCFLDFAQPSLPEALAQLADAQTVLVPLLISTGYHLRVDLPAALTVIGLPLTHLAGALGPQPLLAEALADRLAEAGAAQHAPVVLAGAGSSDPTALADTTRMADRSHRLPVHRRGRSRTAAGTRGRVRRPREERAEL
ncbi:CbiX/SirB N-terminal domain-containing protein, partial [Kitasatospora sp. NPDC006786]|uniref:sirohydrochlorin chelatase n=1 Tax=Kitasatospora sp. NPDC006786 TaxID=3157187 RepID=UPI00340168FF